MLWVSGVKTLRQCGACSAHAFRATCSFQYFKYCRFTQCVSVADGLCCMAYWSYFFGLGSSLGTLAPSPNIRKLNVADTSRVAVACPNVDHGRVVPARFQNIRISLSQLSPFPKPCHRKRKSEASQSITGPPQSIPWNLSGHGDQFPVTSFFSLKRPSHHSWLWAFAMAAMADLSQNFKSPAVSIYTSQSLYNDSNKGNNSDNNEVKQRRLKSARLIGEYAKLYLDCSFTIN
jgi:hypothetical protein